MATSVAARSRGRRTRSVIDRTARGRPLGAVSVGLLIAGGSVLLLQLGGVIAEVPPMAERAEGVEGPQLPVWLDIAVVLGTAVAGP